MSRKPDIAVFVASLALGGVGKMRVHLINEFAARGYQVDLLVADTDSPYMKMVSPNVRIVKMRTSNAIFGVPGMVKYLFMQRPRVLLTQRIRVNVLALRAKKLARSKAKVFVTANTNITRQLQSLKPEKREKQRAMLRRYYPMNDGIVAVSKGVAEDTALNVGWPAERIKVAHNPVVVPGLFERAAASLDHPWFAQGQPPVLLGVGRLEPQKDFVSLVKAFAKVRQERPCRLMILGEGKLRDELDGLATQLGVAADLQMPGFKDNPYQYMSRAAVFVLSSAWEGSPNGLTEALALGTPVVATNCPNGPNEILEEGRYGPLVEVGDVEALAGAIEDTLQQPHDREFQRKGGERYTLENSASEYLEALGFAPYAK
jgi:glycosyltransferase involved in cell wall biosynthesis